MAFKNNGEYGIEDVRPEEEDLRLIPDELISLTREGTDLLGKPEYMALEELMECNTSPNTSANPPCLAVNADYDVYPNIAELAEWWKLSNLKTGGIQEIMRNYRDERTLVIRMNRIIPVNELVKTYGD